MRISKLIGYRLSTVFKVYLRFCSQLATKPWIAAISFTGEFHSSANRD